MIAAIYVRKSTDQIGIADEQKSVTRQVSGIRAFCREGLDADDALLVRDGLTKPFAGHDNHLHLRFA